MKYLHTLTYISFLLPAFNCVHFGYTEEDGPDKWEGICKTGNRQSPIDIQASAVVWDNGLPQIHFANYGKTGGQLFVSNNGHTILVSGFEKWGKDRPYIYGGALTSEYDLVQFHFHWGQDNATGSEHTIHGLHYPGEIHFVHRKRGLPEDAILQPDSLAVVGVFMGLGNDPSPLSPLMPAIKQIVSKPGEIVEQANEFNLMDLLPRQLATFYTYEGSLTTPGCDEVVIWTVFTDPISVTIDQLKIFRETIITDDGKPGSNYRPTLPLNKRKIRFRPATKVSSRVQPLFTNFIAIILAVSFLNSASLPCKNL